MKLPATMSGRTGSGRRKYHFNTFHLATYKTTLNVFLMQANCSAPQYNFRSDSFDNTQMTHAAIAYMLAEKF